MSSLSEKHISSFADRKGPKLVAKKSGKGVVVQKGLCAHCALAAECTFPRDPDRPILFCDEFEGLQIRVPSKVARTSGATSGKVVVNPEQNDDANIYKGLCRTCENRRHCTFPKPEGGVWRCEEYK